MAKLTAKLSISSSDLLSQSLGLASSKTLTVTEGKLEKKSITATTKGSAITLFAAADFSVGTYVYLKNTDTTATDKIMIYIGGADQIIMEGGEWAWFPWSGDVDIKAYVTTTGTILEFGIFT